MPPLDDNGASPPPAAAAAKGYALMQDPLKNRGLAFTPAARRAHGLAGLLPPAVFDHATQEAAALAQFRGAAQPLDKYMFLRHVHDTDERLFYALLVQHTVEVMPIVYTPTVGAACQAWSHLYSGKPRGLYVSLEDRGRVAEVLAHWPHKDVKAICFTDGERILGLGDLGAGGMGIAVGKLALYTACAGVAPSACLPVTLDVGTNNASLLSDPLYLGLRRRRAAPGSEAYDGLVEEFMVACMAKYGPTVLLQFEDFGNANAFRLLAKYQPRCNTFNDDIQGTASVVLAGLLASNRAPGAAVTSLGAHDLLFFGAGEAGVGIADLAALTISQEKGTTVAEARRKIWLVDSKGLITSARSGLARHKQPYAHPPPPGWPTDGSSSSSPPASAASASAAASASSESQLVAAIRVLKPTALIGVSAVAGAFTEEVCRLMGAHHAAPVIFALSNPTSKAECTPAQAYEWTQGRCLFASGSPFDPVTLPPEDPGGQGPRGQPRTRVPGQGNNAYVFPGVGLAAVACGSTHVTDEDMVAAARALAAQVTPHRLEVGCLYPPLGEIRAVSARIAAAVAQCMYARGDASVHPQPKDLLAHCEAHMWHPGSASEEETEKEPKEEPKEEPSTNGEEPASKKARP